MAGCKTDLTPQKPILQFPKRAMTQLKAIAVLDWYYNQSDSDLGFSAQCFDGMPQSERDFHPSDDAMKAAAKQRAVRSALNDLSPNLQRALEAAYNPPVLATQLKLKYGLLAGLVAHHWPPKTSSELTRVVETSKKILVTAHKAFLLSYKPASNASPWLKKFQALSSCQS